MSITETRPEVAEEPEPAPAPAPPQRSALVDWLTAVDHKQIGVAYLSTAFLFALVGAVAAMIWRIELFSPGLQLLTKRNDLQTVTLMLSATFFLFLAPAFVGLATYLVPLQIGATRLAFPRLQALAYWLFLGGGAMVVASYFVHGGPYSAQALLVVPGAAQGGQASSLWLLGMGTVGVAAIGAAMGLVATLVNHRAPGLTLERLPMFSWATMVAGLIVIFATPVFVAGLVLHGVNLGHGGKFFGGSTSPVLWQHLLWLHARPELLTLLVMGAGVVSEVVPVFSRRRLPAYKPALVLVGATGALTLLVWANSHARADAPTAPTFSVAASLFLVPLGLLVLMWLGTLATGRPRPSAALAHALGFVLTLGVGVAAGLSALAVHVNGGTAWAEGQLGLLLWAPAVFALSAGIYYWAPKLWGRFLDEWLGYLQFLLLLVGSLLAWVPAYTGLRDFPRWAVDTSGRFTAYNRVAAVGYGFLVLALAVLVLNVAGSIWARRGRPAPADAWNEGATLEWLAASPPPPHNFDPDTIPEIRSEQPVLDLRPATAERDA